MPLYRRTAVLPQGGLYARMWSRQRHMMDIDIPAAMDAVQDASDAYAGGSDRGCDDSDDGGEGNGDGEGEGNAAGTPKPRGGVGNAKRILRGRTPAAETTEAEDTDCAGSDHGSPQERGSGSVAAALARPLATLPPVACSPREALASPGRSTLHAGSTANPKSRPPSGSVQLRPAGSRGVPSNVPGRRASPPIREASDPGDGGDEHETEAEGADGDADSQVAAATRPTATSAMLAIPAAGRAAAAAATVAERPLGWSRSESVDDLNRHPSPARLRIMTRLGLADHSSSFPSVAPSDIEDSEDDARSLAAASGRFAASGSTVARTTPMRAATADTDAVDVTAAAFRGARQVTGQRARASARPGARSGHGNAAYDDGLSAPLLPVWSGDVEEGEGPGPRPQGSSGR
uniref:Uncharacterized protein n=1 Tax=Chlamydomonas euryale TaxID=1486919 RepID=A0A7R9YUL4_9CHLO|mmetsp:Transcript_25702/g.76069  ORF Transcript_25702/g.76069 Transcript_25702/m.76069 type:complete len:404 (+) Transcript_25702:154-1365(+)